MFYAIQELPLSPTSGKKPLYTVINRISGHQFSKGSTLKTAQAQMARLYIKAKEMDGRGVEMQGKGGDPEKLIYDSMSDADLHKYFPNAKIVKYNEIPRGVGAEEWLKVGEVLFILYESEENSGHWVALARGATAFYYFDSYGHKPDVPLTWISPAKRAELGETTPILSDMFKITKYPVYYNNYPYQSKKEDIATCGRWATLFLIHFKKFKGDLKSFKIETMKRANGRPLDKFVTNIIDK